MSMFNQMFYQYMKMSPNGNIFRVTGPLCWEFTGDRWIPRMKANDTGLWCFLWSAPEPTNEETLETQVIWGAIAVIMTSFLCNKNVCFCGWMFSYCFFSKAISCRWWWRPIQKSETSTSVGPRVAQYPWWSAPYGCSRDGDAGSAFASIIRWTQGGYQVRQYF